MPDTAVVAFSDRTRDAQRECESGHYCLKGVRYKCPEGRYGDKVRETNSSCTGECDAGYYCEEGNSDRRQFECGGAHLFCPANSSTPIRVLEKYYSNENSAEKVSGGEARSNKLRRRFWVHPPVALIQPFVGSFASNSSDIVSNAVNSISLAIRCARRRFAAPRRFAPLASTVLKESALCARKVTTAKGRAIQD